MFARARARVRKKEREPFISFRCLMVCCVSMREKESNGASAKGARNERGNDRERELITEVSRVSSLLPSEIPR